MKKSVSFIVLIFSTVLIALSACGSDNHKDNPQKDTTTVSNIEKNKEVTKDPYKEAKLQDNEIIATFEDFSYGDYYHYGFKSSAGKYYSFNQMPADAKYQFDYVTDEIPEPRANPELVGKKFKIKFHTEITENTNDEGNEFEYFIVDEIELLD